ncbi:hypothetical protein IAR55_004927 [Kwoniella newhampshirensis]|uniref:DUF2428 domain-containing protein n=1 Tax=Kwoniella newhampshirensis TaxID=1651941 RepID=A0AAW0YWW2_9TREE
METCRKALSKAKVNDIKDGTLLLMGSDLILDTYPESLQLKHLELIVHVLRHLSTWFSLAQAPSDPLFVRVQETIIPSLQPNGYLATIALSNLENPLKVQQTRAGEILSAAAKLATHLPPTSSGSSDLIPSTFMVPLFRKVISDGVSRRADLSAILAMLDHIPSSVLPPTLLDDLLEDLGVVDLANMRCILIAHLLTTQSISPASGNETSILQPLMPYFDSNDHSHTVLVNLKRYLLPALFERSPSSLPALLALLSTRPKLFAAWVTVASIGVSTDLLKVEDLPREDLEDALAHEDVDVRLRAFELVAGARSHYTPDVIELIKKGFVYNATLSNAGSRSTFSSATYAFLIRLHQLETVTHRNARKKIRTPAVEAEAARLVHVLSTSSSFQRWFLLEHIDNGIKQARRYPVVDVLLALNLLARYLEVFGEREEVQQKVFTKERVEGLIACQSSEFAEVRSRARDILKSASLPLPGYEDLSTPASQALLASALRSLKQPRKTQAEAGKAALCILFSGLAIEDLRQERSISFVSDLIGRLEGSVEVAEFDLVKGIEEFPLHGLLSAIRDLLLCLSLNTDEARSAWRPVFRHLKDLINRIWTVTRPVISLTSTKSESTEGDQPEHEIARAFEVMGGGDGVEDDDENMDHTGLLSGCWRATKDAGELLDTIITLPISQHVGNQTVWTKEEVNQAGRSFLTWLHEIRHRGTFSKIALAFAHLVEVIRPNESLRDLCDGWLDYELITIKSDLHSITRRSAALPYSFLSLVANDPALLDIAIISLLDMASVKNSTTSNITKVHAFNVLKIVLLDARQTKFFDLYFERGVMTALGAFASEDWNVRNVGLILFSTLVHRCLSPPRGGQDYYRSGSTLSTRQSFSTFHVKYPQIVPFITTCLLHAASGAREPSNEHSPLFPILIIIRSLRWSEDFQDLQAEVVRAVKPFLSSREYQLRQVAAQALSSLVSPEEALHSALSIPNNLSAMDLNHTHGQLLLLHQHIANVIKWAEVDVRSKQILEDDLMSLVKLQMTVHCPPIAQAALLSANDYIRNAVPATTALVQKMISILHDCLRKGKDSFAPGLDVEHSACVHFMLDHSPTVFTVLNLLSSKSTDETHQIVLGRLPLNSTLHTADIFKGVVHYASSPDNRISDSTRVLALDALAEIRWPIEAMSHIGDKHEEIREALWQVRGSRCVPVREAALPAVAWALDQILSWRSTTESSAKHTQLVADSILQSSHEDESQPTRFSAYKALEHLTAHLFASSTSYHPNICLHQALLRLLQDDDEEIRHGAAGIVTSGLGRNRGVVQSRAVELWWEWVKGYLHKVTEPIRVEWLKWISDLAEDRSGLEEDLKVLSGETGAEVIFEVESSNIYRDPLVDLKFANDALLDWEPVRPSANDGRIDFAPVRPLSIPATICPAQPDCSPIDRAWEAMRALMRREEAKSRSTLRQMS